MSQIKKKFIENNAIDGTKFQLLNGQTMRAVDTLGVDRDLFYFNSSNEWQFSVTPKLSVDPQGNNDLVRKSYVDSEVSAEESARIAAVSAEESARISADNALDARLDIIEGSNTTEGSIAKAEKDAKDYADQKIADLINGAPGVLDTLKELSDALGGDENFATTIANQLTQIGLDIDALESSAGSDLSAEESARIAADNALDARLDTLEGADTVVGSVAKALKDAKDYTDAEVLSEESARIAADLVEQSARIAADNALDSRLDTIEGSDATEGSIAKAEKDAKDYTDAEVLSEESARIAADDALDARLDIIEGADTVVGSVAKALKDAKDYTDAEVLSEESARIAADLVEQSARIAADNALDSRLDTLEGADTVVGSVAKALKDAKDYADAIDLDLQGQIDSLDGYTLDLRGDLDQEITDRQSAVSTEQSARIAADLVEQSARIAADDALDARLDIIEGSNTTEGSVAKALKDAKDYTDQEISGLINGAPGLLDTLKELSDALGGDENFATTIANQLTQIGLDIDALESSAGSDLSAEESARIAADNALDARLDTLEGADTVVGSVAKALKDAKDYTDAEVLSEESARIAADGVLQGNIDAEQSARIAADDTLQDNIDAESSARIAADAALQTDIGTEAATRLSADNALDARLDTLEGADNVPGSVAKALKDAKDYTDAEVAAEETRAIAAEGVLQGNIDALDSRLDTLEGADTVVGSVAKALKDAKDYTDAEVLSEESARISADNALDARLDIIEGADTVEGSVAKAEKDAKDYTDAEVADEASLRTTADQALQAQIDTINDVLHEKEKFVLTGTNITNGYINLAHEVIEKSLLVTVDRLVAHAGDDYTVSVVSGVTRITFAGSLASGEDEELVAGDIVRVMYRYQS
jgi:formylmethanofuran dehydrogenase subunit D